MPRCLRALVEVRSFRCSAQHTLIRTHSKEQLVALDRRKLLQVLDLGVSSSVFSLKSFGGDFCMADGPFDAACEQVSVCHREVKECCGGGGAGGDVQKGTSLFSVRFRLGL